ncbi:MAG: YqhG family protein [Bacillus sp. (in: firmicutes)]
MKQSDIQQFLRRYFSANHCEILEDHPAYLSIQLTNEMDKALMNRPFYWHYLEKTGGEPNPAKLTLITDPQQVPEGIKGETVHFGSPRLHQIFGSTQKLGSFIRLFEERNPHSSGNTALHPWLGANIKVSFISDRKKDVFFSLGLHLISGQIITDFHTEMLTKRLTPKIPDLSFTISPIIMPKSGMLRLDRYVRLQLASEDHEWAEKALQKWESDRSLLEHFYEDEEDTENLELEREALRLQYEPHIDVSVINGGMFYLQAHG